MSDIDDVTALHLAAGHDIIAIAVTSIAMTAGTAEDVRLTRFTRPGAYPRLPAEASTLEWWARRIIGDLMKSGWTPPDEHAIAAAIHAAHERAAWWDANGKKPCRSCGHLHSAHMGEGGRCVDCETFDAAECWTWTPAEEST